MVASHLLQWVEFQIDTEGRPLGGTRDYLSSDGVRVAPVVRLLRELA
jgi:hypothetical protein